MKKALKVVLSCMLTVCLLLTPFSGVMVFARSGGPNISVSIRNYDYVLQDTAISVQYTAKSGTTLASCVTTVEGISLGTDASVTFTPADLSLTNGLHTLVAKATDADGDSNINVVTFVVTDSMDIDFTYAEDESIVPSVDGATAAYHAVTPLDYTFGYGTTTDGNVNITDALAYDAYTTYAMKYYNEAAQVDSAAGIPYQTYTVNLNGKTDGEVVLRQTGSTFAGERIALKIYNPNTTQWDVLGTYYGSDSISASVDVAKYAYNDALHVMAILDYVTNGSNTMIWSTDPQHYTKFEDLYEYYYQVYQYAADEYVAGNVGYILTTGDIVDDLPSTTAAIKQWEVADQAMSYVEAVGMPNGLVSGNHDVKTFKKPDYTNGDPDVDYSKFWQTFPASRYNDKAWYGGSLNNNASHYDLITIGNTDFVILYLGYGVEATDETIVWANNVLEMYSHRTAIIATHQYLDAATADRAPASRAQLIYDKIVNPNPNVKVVLCGHDDGSIVRERTASDGRTVYELLADYQFVEAEDPSFYKNEHYIGSVPSCCGDGYIRLLTVEGSTLSSVTYSPITNRYNPYGDRENISIDLGNDAPNRFMSTVAFSAYVVGEKITGDDLFTNNNAIVITKKATGSTEAPTNQPATPNNTYYAHAAATVPNVEYKTDILAAAGLANGVKNTAWTPYQNLGLTVDLTKTPYLYYSIDVAEGGNFTFALVNNTNYAPWLVFRDATGTGAYLNNGNANWDSYTAREQYITASETGCVDMRTISTDPNKATWILNQLTFYNSMGKDVIVNYMFFGSAPIEEDINEPGDLKAYHHVSYVDYPQVPDNSQAYTPVDLQALTALIEKAETFDLALYTPESAANLTAALEAYTSIDTTNDAAVSNLYFNISCAIGALKKPVESIDPSTLQSVHVYNMTASQWSTSDTIKTPLDSGFMLSRNTKNGWASVNKSDSYQIKSNNGKIYINLDVEATCSWSIHLVAAQANVSGTIVINHAIDNAFNRIDCDSMDGVYRGVYDITEAFSALGMDPSATISISKTYLYIVPGDGSPQYTDLATNPDTVTYKYIDIMTDIAQSDTADKSTLQALINEITALDSSLYTSGSWSTMQTSLVKANAAMNDANAAQADVNLVTLELKNAKNKLKLISEIVAEPEGSLLPADEGKWVQYQANTMNIYRDENNHTVFQNTNGNWPSATYTFPETLEYTVADHQIAVDITIGINSRIDLLINGKWVNIGKYITGGKMNGDDMLAGTYTAEIPLSKLVTDSDTAVFGGTLVYSIGSPAASSGVTVRQLQVTKYVAPPHVEDEKLDLIPENDDEWTIVAGDGSVEVENGVLTATNNGDGDLRITLNNAEYFNLKELNALHMQFSTDAPFKMAFQITSTVDRTSQWLNTSNNYPSLFTVENDGAAAGDYDVNMEIRDLSNSINDKTSCYFQQFIILVRAKGTFTLNVAEMIAYDNFNWDEDLTTYGPAATPTNPYYAHAAQTAPKVENKFDLLKAINYPTHPSITAWTKIGDQASSPLGIEVDISKTPYLYYSVAMEAGANFTFALYSNSTYSPWLSFLDCNKGNAVLNEGATNWDSYTNREQYAVTSQTGCIDMRQYLKDPAKQQWIINQINFYNSTGKNVIISYLFFGSEPIEVFPEVTVGDINGDEDIDTIDALYCLNISAGKIRATAAQIYSADFDKDGTVTFFDALSLFAQVAGTTTDNIITNTP